MSYIHKEVNGIDILALEDSIDLYSTPPIKKFVKTLLRGNEKKIRNYSRTSRSSQFTSFG